MTGASPGHTQGTRNLAVMLTRRCDMRCAHCSVASHPEVKDPQDDDRLRGWVRDAIDSGVRQIQFTGGEPMLRRELLLELLGACRRAGVRAAMTTNGSWATSSAEARIWLRRLRRAGLTSLSVSYDRYHAEFMGPEPVLYIAAACAEHDFPLGIGVTRVADDEDLESLVEPFSGLDRVHVRFYDVQWIGGARRFERADLRGEVEGFCNAAASAALTDDGRVTACNGPSYFSNPDSPLVIGNAAEQPVGHLLAAHAADPILGHIRAEGPSGLRTLLEGTDVGDAFPFRDSYSGMCELCLHMTEAPEVVAELRRQLDRREALRARDVGKSQLINDLRSTGGALNRGTVNASGIGAVVIGRVVDGVWPHGSEIVLGRADLDWLRLTEYLIECNLAPVLVDAVEDPVLERWAPSFVSRRIDHAARDCAIRSGIQRDLLERIDGVLGEVGSRGVLLKGAAWLADQPRLAHPVRASGDIDLYVEPEAAPEVHRRLIDKADLRPTSERRRTAEHHLSMLTLLGVGVEVHTAVMAPRWGLPEEELLAEVRPASPSFDHLDSLHREARMVHAAVHCSAHLFSHGAKLAWELARHCKDTADSSTVIDWDRLLKLVADMRMPRAFWVPFTVLAADMKLDVPDAVLGSATDDGRFRRSSLLARKQIWTAAGRAHEDNVFVRQGIYSMLEESVPSRLVSLGGLLAGSLQPWRRRAQAANRHRHGAGLLRQARSAVADWRRYRYALRAARQRSS